MNLIERKILICSTWYCSFKMIGLAFEGISSFLHHKRHKTLNKAIKQINGRQSIEHNRIYHLEDTMIMYAKYNSDTLTNLIVTVHRMHNFNLTKGKVICR